MRILRGNHRKMVIVMEVNAIEECGYFLVVEKMMIL